MSILLKGLKMPEKCLDCKLCAFIPIGEDGLMTKCLPLNRATDVEKLRHDCPLVAVPDHGRLIDADKLIADAKEDLLPDSEIFPMCKDNERYWYWNDGANNVIDLANTAPTVIEADRSDTPTECTNRADRSE